MGAPCEIERIHVCWRLHYSQFWNLLRSLQSPTVIPYILDHESPQLFVAQLASEFKAVKCVWIQGVLSNISRRKDMTNTDRCDDATFEQINSLKNFYQWKDGYILGSTTSCIHFLSVEVHNTKYSRLPKHTKSVPLSAERLILLQSDGAIVVSVNAADAAASALIRSRGGCRHMYEYQCNRAIMMEHFCTSKDLIITELLPKLQQVQLYIRRFICAFTITNAVDCLHFKVSSATEKLLTTSLSSMIRDTHLKKVLRNFFQKCFSLIIVET